MAGMRVGDTKLKSLQKKAANLISAVESLPILFNQEETRLKRKAEVARLKLVHSEILQQVERDRHREVVASIGYNQGRLLINGAGALIAALSQNKKWRSVSRALLTEAALEKRTFGTVFIRIDHQGIPDGMDVVCISRLGRESNQSETEVINRLKKDGSLLLSEENFSRLIDKLVEGILKGQLALPIGIQTLSQMQTSLPLRLITYDKS